MFISLLFKLTVFVLCALTPSALASGCRSHTPALRKAIEDLELKGFKCGTPQLTIEPGEVDTPEKTDVYRFYKDTLVYLVNSTTNRNVSQIGANFEFSFYTNGPVFLDGFPQPVSLRVPKSKIEFTHRELTVCTHYDPKSNAAKTVEIQAEIQVKGVIGLTGVCRTEKQVQVSAER